MVGCARLAHSVAPNADRDSPSGEEKPACINCQRQGETCDYSIRLNWDGRTKKKDEGKAGSQIIAFSPTPSTASKRGPPSPDPNIGMNNGSVSFTGMSPIPTAPSPMAHDSNLPTIQPAPPHGLHEPTLAVPPQYGPGIPMTQQDFQPSLLPAPPILRNPRWGDSKGHNATAPQINSVPQIRQQQVFTSPYPSPQESGFTGPTLSNGMYNPATAYSMQMPPPMTSTPQYLGESISSPFNTAKRVRLSPQTDIFGGPTPPMYPRQNGMDQGMPSTPSLFPPQYSMANPLTPAASSASISQDNDDRRISVSSLLSDDPGPPSSKRPSNSSGRSGQSGPTSEPAAPPRRGSLHQRMISYSETELYGHDRGAPDFDIPRNNDTMAISGQSPSEHSEFGSWLEAEFEDASFGFGTANKDTVFAMGGYYSSQVPIKIPRKLEPLPATLSENPMNLLYFHHFLNHTARILVPHDCPENPFKTILPKSTPLILCRALLTDPNSGC
jgi:hypothetical protein